MKDLGVKKIENHCSEELLSECSSDAGVLQSDVNFEIEIQQE